MIVWLRLDFGCRIMSMNLNVPNEYSELVKVCVCRGVYIPEHSEFESDHPEHTKYVHQPWNKTLFLKQQQNFFDVLDAHQVELYFLTPEAKHIWLAYTRDFGFVIKDKLFYCAKRNLPVRIGEIESVLEDFALLPEQVVEITEGTIEGGDVLVDDEVTYVGLGSRSSRVAVNQLREFTEVKPLELGENVMHLDTRMTILPKRKLLIYTPSFKDEDLKFLSDRYDFIEVTKEECDSLATNVFVINPETIVVDAAHERIAEKLRGMDFTVEVVDYSEPIAISGSFRCTTFPMVRK